ncbi:MAG: AsnC family transcriptional regulator [Candidatus Proteinoplasmatales archaeon SG8-5]|nr:MAG: AsnC family transcriptional regulator [Candidatus Proteinoplasmatales archaeon SG8-5]
MLTGFILINVEAKMENKVYDALAKVDQIEGIREVFGQYDIIARIEARNLKEMRALIINKVRNTPGVIATTTLITSD